MVDKEKELEETANSVGFIVVRNCIDSRCRLWPYGLFHQQLDTFYCSTWEQAVEYIVKQPIKVVTG